MGYCQIFIFINRSWRKCFYHYKAIQSISKLIKPIFNFFAFLSYQYSIQERKRYIKQMSYKSHMAQQQHNTHNNHEHHHHKFKMVEIDKFVKAHFDLVVPLLQKYQSGKFQNIQLQHVYAQKSGEKDWIYWAHIKAGLPEHKQDWTVIYQLKDLLAYLDSVHEGHKTFF